MEPTKEQLEQEFIDSEERTSEHLRTPAEIRAQRLATCSSCEFKTTIFGLDACGDCNCLLGFKIPIISANCPKGKW